MSRIPAHNCCGRARRCSSYSSAVPAVLLLAAAITSAASPLRVEEVEQESQGVPYDPQEVLAYYHRYLNQLPSSQGGASMYDKRKSIYSFGLGKRRQDYSFGLGKRVQDYAFGLGKRSRDDYSFGLGKRDRDYAFGLGKWNKAYSFGLGKRYTDDEKETTEKQSNNLAISRALKSYSFGLGKRDIQDNALDKSAENDGHADIVRSTRSATHSNEDIEDLEEMNDDSDNQNWNGMYELDLGKRAYTGGKYNFGLGKREIIYPSNIFDYPKRVPDDHFFGLGKRSRSYGFGLGKRLYRDYSFGLGKRNSDKNMMAPYFLRSNNPMQSKHSKMSSPVVFGRRSFDFGLGKRSNSQDYLTQDKDYYNFESGRNIPLIRDLFMDNTGRNGAYHFGLFRTDQEPDDNEEYEEHMRTGVF